jgi:coatomer subunit beta
MITQPDETIQYRQLKGKGKGLNEFDITEEISGAGAGSSQFMSEIQNDIDQKIYQLTGYSDPIYAEAIAEVHHYDIKL